MILPYNVEAEKAVLGSIMLDNSKIANVNKYLCESDFYSPEHQIIYKSIIDLHTNNQVADIITLDNINKFDYLVMLADSITTTENVMYYAKIVKAKSVRRQYIIASQEVATLAANGEYENIIDFKNDVLSKMNIDIGMSYDNKVRIGEILLETIAQLEDEYKNKNESKLKYGIYWLDKKTGGAYANELTILAARPSIGKTSLALQFALNIAKRNNHVAIFSLEMGKSQLIKRFISNVVLLDSNKIRTGYNITNDDWAKVAKSIGFIGDLKIFIYDDVFRIEQIRSICLELKAKNELDYLIIDYLQLCDTIKKCGNPNERVSYISRLLKLISKELRIPVLCLSQLNRANESDNRTPELRDLRDSGSIEQDADNVFFLYDENAGQQQSEFIAVKDIKLIIAKQRAGVRDIAHNIKFYPNTQKWE